MSDGYEAPDMGKKSKWDLVEKLLGSTDLHYHFRTRSLFKYLKRSDKSTAIRVCEFGCGVGGNLLRMGEAWRGMVGVGIDIDRESILIARRAAAVKGLHNLSFYCAGSAELAPEGHSNFDYILLIDVLEHLDDPGSVLHELGGILKPEGQFLVSVPTHRYPLVFGRAYHDAVGHVRDGFTLSELDDLIGDRYRRIQHKYSTGLLASMACACFYRIIPKIRSRKISIASMLGLHISRLFDVFNGPSVSCSLWAVYREKRSDE